MDYSEFIRCAKFSAKCTELDADSYLHLAMNYPDALLFATALQYEAFGISVPDTAEDIQANKVVTTQAFLRDTQLVPLEAATREEIAKMLENEGSYKTIKTNKPIALYELKETSCPPEQYALICEQFSPPLHAAVLSTQLKTLLQKIGIEIEMKDFEGLPIVGYYEAETNRGYIAQNTNMFKQSAGFCQVFAEGMTECVSTSSGSIYEVEALGLLSTLESKYNIAPSFKEETKREAIFKEASNLSSFSPERTLRAIHQRFQFSQEQLHEIGKEFVLAPQQAVSINKPLAEEINASFMKDL